MSTFNLESQARELVEQIARGCKDGNLGSATVAIYDTAWLSMISKDLNGKLEWLFPECFAYILDHQMADGGWQPCSSVIDAILNSLAALLAIKKHISAFNSQGAGNVMDLEKSVSNATAFLHKTLQRWDVENSVHVGFEILVPALLSMLEDEDIQLDFPGKKALNKLYRLKLAKFEPSYLYSSRSTFIHSLEAFIGKVDFDKLRHHQTFGSMMGSPASTAAYLMQRSSWDLEAELYLKGVIAQGAGKGSGGVASVFPTNIFEATWVISTLVQNGYTTDILGAENLDVVADYLQEHLQQQNGLIGFTPGVLADADDSAKTILTLNLLGRPTTSASIIQHFESEQGHIRTYLGERDASFSANCNVLMALLSCPDVSMHEYKIARIAIYICTVWFEGLVKDKWNTSPGYSMMLLAEALMKLLRLWDEGILIGLPQTLLKERIPTVLIQVLNRTLFSQNSDGSWGSCSRAETSAYAVLTLAAVLPIPWIQTSGENVHSALRTGQAFLASSPDEWVQPHYLWIEKVTYGSANLSNAYCLAAMKCAKDNYSWSKKIQDLMENPQKSIAILSRFFSTLEPFQSEAPWKLRASIVESFSFLARLKGISTSIFPRLSGTKNEYLKYIPCTWVVINNYQKLSLPTDLLWDMMYLTVCNFQVDEYMETVAAQIGKDDFEPLKASIRSLFKEEHAGKISLKRPHPDSIKATNSHNQKNGNCETGLESSLISFESVLKHYIKTMLEYPHIQEASSLNKANLRYEIEVFLLSHITQLQDNARFSRQENWSPERTVVFSTPRSPYSIWATTTGAESVSCPFSFAFFTCLLGLSSGESGDSYSSTYQRYLAQDLCTRLAVMSRMYNDYGSIARDRAEANINSVNFPEFHSRSIEQQQSASSQDVQASETMLKAELLSLAQYERACVDTAMEALLRNMETGTRTGKAKADGVRLFAGVTALYADIYVARDLSNSLKR
ncbi:hypothetical protein MMC27_007579 [Xylographa pallens]|nr:hypothetical protein [Xylographa pallens]